MRNIQKQIYHEYSGREQVPQYIQNTQNWVKWEIRPWQWLVTANEKNGELRGRKQPLWCQLFFEIYQMYLMYMITWYSTSMLHITVQDQAFCIYIWLHDITHPTPDLVPSAQTVCFTMWNVRHYPNIIHIPVATLNTILRQQSTDINTVYW